MQHENANAESDHENIRKEKPFTFRELPNIRSNSVKKKTSNTKKSFIIKIPTIVHILISIFILYFFKKEKNSMRKTCESERERKKN